MVAAVSNPIDHDLLVTRLRAYIAQLRKDGRYGQAQTLENILLGDNQ